MEKDIDYIKAIKNLTEEEFIKLLEHSDEDFLRKFFIEYTKTLDNTSVYNYKTGLFWRGFRKESIPFKRFIKFYIEEVYKNENLLFSEMIYNVTGTEITKNNTISLEEAIKSIDDSEYSKILSTLFNFNITYTADDIKNKIAEVQALANEETEKLKEEFHKIINEKEEEIASLNHKLELLDSTNDIITKLQNDLNNKDEEIKTKNNKIKLLEEQIESNITKPRIPIHSLDTKVILEDLNDFLIVNGLFFNKHDIYNFHSALATRKLTIISGMPGIGKSCLALKYAEFFGLNEKDLTLLFLPISPSYTEPSDLLGFYNPANDLYVCAETNLVEFLIHAQNNPDKMHMVIFDEMNLGQIEHWFSPFISILERNDEHTIRLYDSNLTAKNNIPSSINIYDNILFVGTINNDITTRNISDRLLDRSYLIKAEKQRFMSYYNDQLVNRGRKFSNKLYDLHQLITNSTCDYDINYITKFNPAELKFLDELDELLQKSSAEKGISYRTIKNIYLYLTAAQGLLKNEEAFDYALLQTVISKISGSFEALEPIFALDETNKSVIENILDHHSNISKFTKTKKEIIKKLTDLERYGYTK